jgi:hypothetical protein
MALRWEQRRAQAAPWTPLHYTHMSHADAAISACLSEEPCRNAAERLARCGEAPAAANVQSESAQVQEPPAEGLEPENAKAARIAHVLGALNQLPDSYKGPTRPRPNGAPRAARHWTALSCPCAPTHGDGVG